MREDEQAEKNGVFPGTAPFVAELGGGCEGVSRHLRRRSGL